MLSMTFDLCRVLSKRINKRVSAESARWKVRSDKGNDGRDKTLLILPTLSHLWSVTNCSESGDFVRCNKGVTRGDRVMIPSSLRFPCSLARSVNDGECEVNRRRYHFSSSIGWLNHRWNTRPIWHCTSTMKASHGYLRERIIAVISNFSRKSWA